MLTKCNSTEKKIVRSKSSTSTHFL